jgi:hypothetical protein
VEDSAERAVALLRRPHHPQLEAITGPPTKIRTVPALWAGGEGAKYWLHVLTEIKNRGVADVCMLVCDGLTGLPDAIGTVGPATITQTCIVHLLRNSFRYAGRQHWDAIAKALKPVYTAPTEAAAKERFAEFTQAWGAKYPAITRLWHNAWAEFTPVLAFDPEIRRIICSTNAIESVNVRIRRAVTPITGGYLVVGHVPYATGLREVAYGALACPIGVAGEVVFPPLRPHDEGSSARSPAPATEQRSR